MSQTTIQPLTMTDLRVDYRGLPALGPVCIAVHAGEFLGVVGPNGAGKSTLLEVMAGVRAPSTGHLAAHPAWRPAYLMQYQGYVPLLPFSVADVVHFGRAGVRRLGSRCAHSDRRAVAAALSDLELVELRRRLYRDLSGGEQRKVQLARLLAQESDVLLLDEPTAGLDLDWQERITGIVGQLHRDRGKTIVMVTHDVDRLPASCTRVLLLKEGRAQALGSPAEVLRPPTLSALYNCRMEVLERNGRYHAFST
jgi:ABC-type cobalamin/Fe3+-siderophores transport system ATPase subunit